MRLLKKKKRYTYDQMFEAFMAGIEVYKPNYKKTHPEWFTTMGTAFMDWIKNI